MATSSPENWMTAVLCMQLGVAILQWGNADQAAHRPLTLA
jgi:hypothetical protein